MKLLTKIVISFFAALFFLSSCSRPSVPFIVAPMQVSVDDEMKIARFNQLLLGKKLTDAAKMRIYIERGLIYDSLGFVAFSQSDFLHALNYNNKVPDIYNFLGVRALMDGDFDGAFFSLNTALELDNNYSFSYLNRAITLYRTGHYQTAKLDALKFYKYNVNEAVSVLWLYLIEKEINDKAALEMLATRYNQMADKTSYTSGIIAFYLGQIDESKLMQRVQEGINDNRQLAERLSETYFYLGKYYQGEGNNERAQMLFKYTLANNIYNFVEHQQALYEIKLLDEK